MAKKQSDPVCSCITYRSSVPIVHERCFWKITVYDASCWKSHRLGRGADWPWVVAVT
ncbi:Queuine tRNA-ribosyltransferase, partial [Dissostichus eleginoides]